MKRYTSFLTGALLTLVALLALGAGRSQPVENDAQVVGKRRMAAISATSSSYRTDLDGGEAGAIAPLVVADSGVAVVTTVSCGGYEKVSVPVLFSSTTGPPTVVITCVRYNPDADGTNVLEYAGSEQTTITGQTAYTVSGKYPGTAEATFETFGCGVVKILAADPSDGNVNLGPVKVH